MGKYKNDLPTLMSSILTRFHQNGKSKKNRGRMPPKRTDIRQIKQIEEISPAIIAKDYQQIELPYNVDEIRNGILDPSKMEVLNSGAFGTIFKLNDRISLKLMYCKNDFGNLLKKGEKVTTSKKELLSNNGSG